MRKRAFPAKAAARFGSNRDCQFLRPRPEAQPEFGLQTSEHRLQLGEGNVGPPELLRGPGAFVAAQAVHARIAHLGTGDRLLDPAQRLEPLARGLGVILDAVVLADTAALLLEPSDALGDLDQALLAARFREALAQLGQSLLKVAIT